jgi:hypothetical protein
MPKKGFKHSKESIEMMRLAKKGKSGTRSGAKLTEATKQKLREKSIGKTGYWKDKTIPLDVREKIRKTNTGKTLSVKHKQNISKGNKGKSHSERHTMNVVESRIGGFWYGNVGLSAAQYCEVWRLVRPRIIAFFGNVCVECGCIIGGHNPCCHHVFYEKKACCMVNEDGIFFSDLNVYGHTKDYCIGTNPNYFVTLCRSCHNKTNGTFKNRKKWADHFKEIVDTRFGGKCYFTKEEMAGKFPPG